MTLIDDLSKRMQNLKNGAKKILELYKTDVEIINNDKPDINRYIKSGALVLVIFFGGFLLWSTFATLESAAVADGVVTVESNRKNIQHLEGGIIATIHVKEGSQVKGGDLLVSLDKTQAKARLELLQGQFFELLAAIARLKAERDNVDDVNFPAELLKSNSAKTQELIKSQKDIFIARQNSLYGQKEILKQRIEQLKKEIDSFNAQVQSQDKQLKFIEEELEAVQYLADKKLIDKPRLLALKREAARLAGNRDEQLGLVAKAQKEIGEAEYQIITLQDEFQKEVLEQLRKHQQTLADTAERAKAAEDILKRTKIVAPLDGTIVNLQFHTVGGVIAPGATIMDLVPSEDILIVEAKIKPQDIDAVYAGLNARVNFTAFKARTTPSLKGKVIHVSADSLVDKTPGAAPFYRAKISISEEQLIHLQGLELYPGMPAQVYVIIDKGTPLQYFLKPITDSLSRAFREN